MEFIENEFMIKMLRELSPIVEDALSTKMYLVDINEDEVTPEFLLIFCYNLIVSELNEIGIEFSDKPEILFESYYNLSVLYYLRKVLDPKEVIASFKKNKDTNIIMLETLNNEETLDDLLNQYIDYLNYVNPNNEELEKLFELNEKAFNNDNFKKYLLNMLNIANEDNDSIADYIVDYQNLINIVSRERTLFKEAIIKIITQLEHIREYRIDGEYLLHKTNQYKRDIINGEHNKIYAWCYSVNKNELDNSLLKLYDKYMDLYYINSTHRIEYWEIHNDENMLSCNNLIEIIADVYTTQLSKMEQIEKINDIVMILKERIFSNKNDLRLDFINKLIEILWR